MTRGAKSSSLAGMQVVACATIFVFGGAEGVTAQVQTGFVEAFRQLNQEFCTDCHTGSEAEARLDLEALSRISIGDKLSDWRRVERVLAAGTMPPEDIEQPDASRRTAVLQSLRHIIRATIQGAANDPGPIVLRRLTNAEYDYCIHDLTGLQLELGRQLVSDSVGASGFTNAPSGQFMQAATVERYLEAAKSVAQHAMIGAGSLTFYEDPGQTGLELSAIRKIQNIYRQYGFRSAAGEGAKPYGLERFSLAFQVAWTFRYRHDLGLADATLEEVAEAVELEAKFAEHIWNVLHAENAQFPLSEIIAAWNRFPTPADIILADGGASAGGKVDFATPIAAASDRLFDDMQAWQARFAGAASAEEEAALLADGAIQVPDRVEFVARGTRRRLVDDHDDFTVDINDKDAYSPDGRLQFRLSVEPASDETEHRAVVIFEDPQFQVRLSDGVDPDPVPLRSVLSSDAIQRLGFGENVGGERISAHDFALQAGQSKTIEVELPEDSRLGQLELTARLDRQTGRDSVVRCTIDDITSERGRQYSSLLRDRDSRAMDRWEGGLQQFARALPQVSQREPAPSDRDPIPAAYDNTYNLPERNFFHTAVKYAREDDFLTQHILPDEVRKELDLAWTDLLTSFDYHDLNFRFVARKFKLEADNQRLEILSNEWIDSLPEEAASLVTGYRDELRRMRQQLRAAEVVHIRDLERFAFRAWRRPLTLTESVELRSFYAAQRNAKRLDHADAVRACIVRILVSPAFLYRIEQDAGSADTKQLTDFELASRLSFSLWSSVPDTELLELAERGKLASDAAVLREQVGRMLQSSKAERMATEFFGQWLGFYQFDEFRGVDVERFPEFDESLRHSLYAEAITFFQHILREDRPYTEILQADYSFVDGRLAEHYNLDLPAVDAPSSLQRVDLPASERGGLLGLGAILTATSAPLRTSPVKRGDWVLRRLIGTPVPPPPADAGSIPAEEVLADGLTVRDRLEAHRRRAECMNCHVRIDPLGFALEHFDSLGRLRDTYSDGQTIHASGELADGTQILGLAGLKAYMKSMDRQFRLTLATKLVAYMLGRSETLADAALIESIASRLEEDSRISTAILTIVESKQFQRIRGVSGLALQSDTPHRTE